MKIIEVSLHRPNLTTLKQAARVLKRGGVVAYPTETAYALGVDATNKQAIARLKRIKPRPQHKSFSVIVADTEMAQKYGKFTSQALELAQRYWPGPITIIVPRRTNTPKTLTGNNSLGMRVSSLKLARTLSRLVGKPIVSTSANIGGPTVYSADRMLKAFQKAKHQPDLVLVAGTLPRRKTSTLISFMSKPPEILRAGTLKPKLPSMRSRHKTKTNAERAKKTQ